MKPTSNLRFIKRVVTFTDESDTVHSRTVNILQQWFESYEVDLSTGKQKGEWQDVRTEQT